MMAGEPYLSLQRVQVICTPTLHARAIQRDKLSFPHADLVIDDECHLSGAPTRQAILEKFNGAVRVGFTATPARTTGAGLGLLYDKLVYGPSVAELTREGYLVPVRYFCPPKFDTRGIPITNGDYSQKQLGSRVNTKALVGDVVSNWLRLARDRKTIVFGVTQAHAKHLQEQFQSVGINAGYVDSESELSERASVLKDFEHGDVQVLCNVGICSYGYDAPAASCVVLARPTKSVVLYLQSVGRGMRPHPGKQDMLLIDHAGAVEEFGFVDEPMPWKLDTEHNASKVREQQTREKRMVVCEKCQTPFTDSPTCPSCGWRIPHHKAKAVRVTDADLEELTRSQVRIVRTWNLEQARRFLGELQVYAEQKGYSPGWAKHQFKAKVGQWPGPEHEGERAEPSAETKAWLLHRKIQWALSKQNPNNQQTQQTQQTRTA